MKLWKTAAKLPLPSAIEGDIKGSFDHIDHHALMNPLRRRVRDGKLNRLMVVFLKVMSEAQLLRADSVISPRVRFYPPC
jgi:retron-type reverse transcriptase